MTEPAVPAPPHLFISHSSDDEPLVESLVAALEERGVTCWVSYRDITPRGGPFWNQIAEAMSACQYVLLLLTPNSNKSVDVQREIANAKDDDNKKPVVVVRAHNIRPDRGLRYYVKEDVWISAFGRNGSLFKSPDRFLRETIDEIVERTGIGLRDDGDNRNPIPDARWWERFRERLAHQPRVRLLLVAAGLVAFGVAISMLVLLLRSNPDTFSLPFELEPGQKAVFSLDDRVDQATDHRVSGSVIWTRAGEIQVGSPSIPIADVTLTYDGTDFDFGTIAGEVGARNGWTIAVSNVGETVAGGELRLQFAR